MCADEIKRMGSCLCGAVTVSADFEKTDLGACHCAKCQKWSGGPFMELECGSTVEFLGDENIQTFNSSKWATRGFCKVCGSHLFIKDTNSGDYGIAVGLFENQDSICFNRQVFYDHKPDFYQFSNSTHNINSDFIYQHYPFTKEENS